MSDLGGSGSSGLSDWALVNSHGELECSDVSSNASSIEVVGLTSESEVEEEDVGHGDPVSRETSPECFELEELMKKADAEKDRKVPASPEAGAVSSQSTSSHDKSDSTSLQGPPTEPAAACCAELLQSGERERASWTGGGVAVARQLSQDSDSPPFSDSILSLSETSSLSITSKSSRDSDSESDFVRLEKESSSISTESEGEEPTTGSEVDVMATSESSVGQGFNFLAGCKAPMFDQQPLAEAKLPLAQYQVQQQSAQHRRQQASPCEALSPPPQQQQQQPTQPDQAQPQQQQLPPPPQQHQHRVAPMDLAPPPEHQDPPPPQPFDQAEEEEGDEDDAREDAALLHPQPLHVHQQPPAAVAPVPVPDRPDDDDEGQNDDGDTESSAEDQYQDDRIESEQSDDAPADDLDQEDLNDLGDLPLEVGARRYIHHNNQRLNGRLNRVVLAALVLALGIGLGHWIGSTREHFSQMTVQLSQLQLLGRMTQSPQEDRDQNRTYLDEMQEEDRDMYQAYSDELREENLKLRRQLEGTSPPDILTLSKPPVQPMMSDIPRLPLLLVASEAEFSALVQGWDPDTQQVLLSARQKLTRIMKERLDRDREDRWDVADARLHDARQKINSLQNQNHELQVVIGKMRYRESGAVTEASSSSSSSTLPPSHYEEGSGGHGDGFAEEGEGEEVQLPVPPPPPSPVPPPPVVRQAEAKVEVQPHGDEDDGVEVSVEDEADFQEETVGFHDNHDSDSTITTTSPKPTRRADSPQPLAVDVNLLRRNLTQERHRADMWRHLYLSARQGEGSGGPGGATTVLNGSACLHYLSQQMNVSALVTYLSGVEDLTDFSRLSSSVLELRRHLLDSLPSFWAELSSTLHSLHSGGDDDGHGGGGGGKERAEEEEVEEEEEAWRASKENSEGEEGREREEEEDTTPRSRKRSEKERKKRDEKERKRSEKERKRHEKERKASEKDRKRSQRKKERKESGGGGGGWKGAGGRWSQGVKKLLNRTRGTLSHLGGKLQHTWGRVRDAAASTTLLLPGNDSVLARVAARVKDGISELTGKVQKKARRWFNNDSDLHHHQQQHGRKKREASMFVGGEREGVSGKRQRKEPHDKQHRKVEAGRGEDNVNRHQHGKNKKEGKMLEKKEEEKSFGKQQRKEKREKHQKLETGHGKNAGRHQGVPSSEEEKRRDRNGKLDHKEPVDSHSKTASKSFKSKEEKASSDQSSAENPQKDRKEARLNKLNFGEEDETRENSTPRREEDAAGEKTRTFNKRAQKARRDFQTTEGSGHKETQLLGRAEEDRVRRDHDKADSLGSEEGQYHRRDLHHAEDSDSKETQFHGNAKEDGVRREFGSPSEDSPSREIRSHTSTEAHNSIQVKAEAKAKFETEKQFQKLFSKIGSMGKPGFDRLNEKDISELFHGMFLSDTFELHLPLSSHHWLRCQFFWWLRAEPQRMLYQPMKKCLQYLAPWQLDFARETETKLATGQCRKERYISCIDPPPEDEEDYYIYVCRGEKDFIADPEEEEAKDLGPDSKEEAGDISPDTKEEAGDIGPDPKEVPGDVGPDPKEGTGDLGSDQTRSSQSTRRSPKGTKEGGEGTQKESSGSHSEGSQHFPSKANRTEEELNAWYFDRVHGRDELRSSEHRSDWLFERASDRDTNRQQEHASDWLFERAANRDESREHEAEGEEEEEEEEDDGFCCDLF